MPRKNHETVVCLLLTGSHPFSWLGPRRVVDWVLSHCGEVRGVDRTVALLPGAAARRADSMPDAEPVTLPPRIAAAPDDALLAWLATQGPASRAGVILLARAATPFLAAGRLEEAVERVRSGAESAVVTALPVRYFGFDGALRDGHSPVLGARCVDADLYRGSSDKWPRIFREVRVNSMEALDVTNREHLTLAQALVDTGAV